MSSLDHDRLLEERPKAPRTAARTGAATAVPKPRPTSRSSQEKAEGERPRTARSTRTTAAKAAPAKATAAKTTATKATVTKATATKAAPAKAAAKPSTPKATPAQATPAKSAAKPATARTAAAKATPAKAAPAKAAPAKAAPAKRTAARRPSPTKRAVPTAVAAPAPAVELPSVVVAVPEETPAEPVATVRFAGVRRRLRLGSAPRRRPAVLLAAALVGALSVGLFSAGSDRAEASSAGSVSVAHALGLTAKQAPAPVAAADQLRMVAAGRAQRQAEETAAAQAQSAADQAAIEAARPKAVNPAPGGVLTTCFCMRWGAMHWGIDLAAPLGTPEYAAEDGVVVKAGPASGFGQAIYIQHANGDVTVYGHMEKILVTDGQVVHAGDEIALMGAEGEATGPHLHFEVHVGGMEGQKIDPIPWLQARGVQI